jgi:hypothetical protein
MDNYYVNPFNEDYKKINLFSGKSTPNTVGSLLDNTFNPNINIGNMLSGTSFPTNSNISNLGLKVKPIYNEGGKILEAGSNIYDTKTFTKPVVSGYNNPSVVNNIQPKNDIIQNDITHSSDGVSTQNILNITQPEITQPEIGSVGYEMENIYSPEESSFIDEYYQRLSSNAQAEYDPEEALQEANRLFQSQIDAQEAYYNDLIEQSRMTNQPEYQKNLDMLRLQQLAGGYGTSGAARAETQKQQNENQRVQNSYESVLRAEMQDKINAIQGNITNYAQKAKENFEKLKSESTEKYLQALRDRPTQRKAAVGQIVEQLLNLGIDIEDLSEEQISEYAKQLSNSATGNITSDNIRSEYKSLKAQAEASQKEAELEERKTLAGIKKTEAETSQIGKVYPTTAAQIAWEREKMNNNTEEKTPTAEQVKQYIRKEMTTQAFKDMSKKEKKDFILANGGEPSDYGY